jgi:hypothetical protein
MKTVRLREEEFDEIAAALEDKARGQHVLIEVLASRFGPESEQVKAETEALARLTDAALTFHGISTWRSNGGKTMPAGSLFQTPVPT